MIKLLIGGSPCTYWSIAQKNGRETTAEGMGWELFKNYLIAKEKFKPDFFLYENNKSAAKAIKDQIKHELDVWDETLFSIDSGARYIEINSALVSARNRQRFYVHNCGDVKQPEDRGILLRDILESGVVGRDKPYHLLVTHQGKARDYFQKQHAQIVCEPVGTTKDGKSFALTAYYSTGQNVPHTLTKHKGSMVAEPVRIPEYGNDEKARPLNAYYSNNCGGFEHRMFSPNPNKQQVDMIAEPIRIGTIESEEQNKDHDSKQYRVYSPDGKATTLCGQGGGVGAKTGLYAVPCDCLLEEADGTFYFIDSNGKKVIVYEVRDGFITIKGKQYPIKLADGFYIIRKLTVTECCRLQTMPDDYCRAVSNSRAYAGLGNGWTAEVIIHLLNGALKDVPRDEEIVVLSMYDGIGTGRYCLDKMGFTNVRYYAYEIDKYAKQISMSNYPDIIQIHYRYH